MTENAIRYQELKEKERANKKDEEIKEKRAKVQNAKDTISGITDTISTGVKLAGLMNDPSWYNLDPQMVKDVAQISFNTPLGAEVTMTGGGKEVIPGIMTIHTAHTIGDKQAINTAAKQIYSYIRSANSGAKNYEPNDIVAYMLTMCDAYAYHACLCRLYSLLNTAKGHNFYYTNRMIEAVGGDVSLRGEIAQLRAYINSYAQRLNAFYCPKELPLFRRRYWMYTNIFKDDDVKKSQEYVFVPEYLTIYDDTQSRCQASRPSFSSVDAIRTFGDSIINALLESSDIAIMSGDILKAYGDGNVLFIQTIPDNYHVESVYSLEVLSQIHNAQILGRCSTDAETGNMADMFSIRCPAGGKIEQGYRLSNNWAEEANIYAAIPDISVTAPAKPLENALLNLYKDQPTPDDLMVATRLSFVTGSMIQYGDKSFYDGVTYAGKPNKCIAPVLTNGSELILYVTIYQIDSGMNVEGSINLDFTYKTFSTANAGDWTIVKSALAFVKMYTKFDWAPQVFWFRGDITSTTAYLTEVFSVIDYHNYAVVAPSVLKNMHYTALLSEYGIPLLGVKVRTR